MKQVVKTMAGACLCLGLLTNAGARAQSFILTDDQSHGVFSFTDNSPGDNVTDIVVDSTTGGSFAMTTLTGWSAEALLSGFDLATFTLDPLGCQSEAGLSSVTGFCYSNTSGSAITGGTTLFSYDPAFDLGLTTTYTVVYTDGSGNTFAQAGDTLLPEPSAAALMLTAVLGLFGLRTVRRMRAGAV
jgi:hypothetical protein